MLFVLNAILIEFVEDNQDEVSHKQMLTGNVVGILAFNH